MGGYIDMDCSKIPLCVYTDEEEALLKSFSIIEKQYKDNFLGASCTTNGDILPDGTVIHCMPLINAGSNSLKFNDFNNVAEVHNYTNLIKANAITLKMKDADKCIECIEYKTGRCYAGCVGMKVVR